MQVKNPEAEYRRLVKMEIEMRALHRAAIYDQMFNAETIVASYFDGYTRALEGALGMDSKERLDVIMSVSKAGKDGFEERHGTGATKLDAPQIHPRSVPFHSLRFFLNPGK